MAVAFVIWPVLQTHTSRRLAVLDFSRPLKNCAHLNSLLRHLHWQGDPRISSHPFCAAPTPCPFDLGVLHTLHGTRQNNMTMKQILMVTQRYGPAGLEHIASRSCGEALSDDAPIRFVRTPRMCRLNNKTMLKIAMH